MHKNVPRWHRWANKMDIYFCFVVLCLVINKNIGKKKIKIIILTLFICLFFYCLWQNLCIDETTLKHAQNLCNWDAAFYEPIFTTHKLFDKISLFTKIYKKNAITYQESKKCHNCHVFMNWRLFSQFWGHVTRFIKVIKLCDNYQGKKLSCCDFGDKKASKTVPLICKIVVKIFSRPNEIFALYRFSICARGFDFNSFFVSCTFFK